MDDVRDAILKSCDQRFRKVAMVINRASAALGNHDDATAERVAQAVAELVSAGRLKAIGDVSQWRDSEVCLQE